MTIIDPGQSYWHQGRLLFALARYFDWANMRMMSQFPIDGGIADLVFLTKHGYATEVEIKISLADWNADLNKGKWDQERPHVARFFYAIPETLENAIPAWLPPYAGILVVRRRSQWGFNDVNEVRAAVRRPAKKLPEADQAMMFRSAYYRFWRQELRFWQGRLFDRERRTV